MVGVLRDQFRNDSGGVAGAVTVNQRGDVQSVPVQPDDMVWLSEEEQALTANAPKHPEDNPFINGTFTLVTEAAEMVHARPLRPVDVPEQEVGAPPMATGEPPKGSRLAGEEVGTPAAVRGEPEPPEVQVAADGKHIVTDAARRRSPQTS